MATVAAILMALLIALPAGAAWNTNAWDSGKIWHMRRMAQDLDAALDERCEWVGESDPADANIWPTWSWLMAWDAAFTNALLSFVDLSQTNAAGLFLITSQVPPMLTYTGVLDIAGVTNPVGVPRFRRDATNKTIWLRLEDLRERRDALSVLTQTTGAWNYDDVDSWLKWRSTAGGSGGSTWTGLQAQAEAAWASTNESGVVPPVIAEAYAEMSGSKSVVLQRRAGRIVPTGLQTGAVHWIRNIDIYILNGWYYTEGRSAFIGGTTYDYSAYFGENTNGPLYLPEYDPLYATAPGTATNYFWRTETAASGTVWWAWYAGDTNGTMPTSWGAVEPGGSTGVVHHGYYFGYAQPDGVGFYDEEIYDHPTTHSYIVLRWTPHYP